MKQSSCYNGTTEICCWVILTCTNGVVTEHSRYPDVDDAYAVYDNLDFCTFDDAWVERLVEE